MNNDIYTDQVLDNHLFNKIGFDEVKQLLCREPDADPSDLISMHHAAAVALQRNAVIEQVNKVHEQFLKTRLKPDTASIEVNTGRQAKIRSLHPVKWIVRIAAMFLLVISAWYAWEFHNTSSHKIYTEIYQPYSVNTNRSAFSEVAPHEMIKQYKEKDYFAVIKTFQLLSVTTNREKFLTAMAYHETGNYHQSISLLEQIIKHNTENGSRLYNDEAEFYIALNYLKLKNGNAALPWFQKIYSIPTHTYNERISKWTIKRLRWLK